MYISDWIIFCRLWPTWCWQWFIEELTLQRVCRHVSFCFFSWPWLTNYTHTYYDKRTPTRWRVLMNYDVHIVAFPPPNPTAATLCCACLPKTYVFHIFYIYIYIKYIHVYYANTCRLKKKNVGEPHFCVWSEYIYLRVYETITYTTVLVKILKTTRVKNYRSGYGTCGQYEWCKF